MPVVAIIMGVFGVYAGWHWKLLHRAMRDVDRYKASVRSAQKVEQDHWLRAVLFGVAAIVIVDVLLRIH
jgi:hypothetical protein